MKVFISHNKVDKVTARTLASLLVQQGADVWFDEWEIGVGEPLTGRIEEGLAQSDCFVLVWSAAAAASNWVGTEMRAFIRQRVENNGLRIVPLMVDDTKLPLLVADYRGFDLAGGATLNEVVEGLMGTPTDVKVAQLLQRKLIELNQRNSVGSDPFPQLVCEQCGSEDLRRTSQVDPQKDDVYYFIHCQECGAGDWTQ